MLTTRCKNITTLSSINKCLDGFNPPTILSERIKHVCFMS